MRRCSELPVAGLDVPLSWVQPRVHLPTIGESFRTTNDFLPLGE